MFTIRFLIPLGLIYGSSEAQFINVACNLYSQIEHPFKVLGTLPLHKAAEVRYFRTSSSSFLFTTSGIVLALEGGI